VEFELQPIAGAPGLFALRSLERPGTRLFVLDAEHYLPDYSPAVDQGRLDALGIRDRGDALLLVVANPSESGTTVNLLAPIVVNRSGGSAAQIILEDQDWPLRAELGARTA